MRHQKRKSRKHSTVQTATAGSVSLVYVDDSMPEIRRTRCGRGFRYLATTGEVVRATATIDRIHALVIPPAWTDVWICEQAWGHLQVTGRDARGRKQCLYHACWRQFRDEAKSDKMFDFANALPGIRRRVAMDLRSRGLPRDKVEKGLLVLLKRSIALRESTSETRQDPSKRLSRTKPAIQSGRGGARVRATHLAGRDVERSPNSVVCPGMHLKKGV